MLGIKKTILMLDEQNYLVYINHTLFKEKGTNYEKEKAYLKTFVDMLWTYRHENPETLKNAQKIETLKEVFELDDLEVM